MTLRKKHLSSDLTIVMVACVALVATIVISISHVYSARSTWHQLETNADNYIANLRETLGILIWSLDEEAVSQLVDAFTQNGQFTRLHVIDRTHTISVTRDLDDGFPAIIRKANIIHENRVVGDLEIGISTKNYYERKKRLLISSAITAVAIIATIMTLTGLILKRLMNKAFQALMHQIGKIRDGDYEVTEDTNRYIEFNSIGDHFNRMAEKVKAREENLKQASMMLKDEIADRMRIEKKLRSSEQQLQDILDFAPAVIYLKDLDGRYRIVNRAFESLHNVERQQIPGLSEADLLPRTDSATAADNMQRIFETGSSLEFEEIFNVANEKRTYSTLQFPLKDDWGKIYGICGISTDISESRRLESHLQQAQKLEAIGTLASGVAHDFNNILQAISGYIELMLFKTDRTGFHHQPLNQMREAVSRATDLIQRLMLFSRKAGVELKPMRLNMAIDPVVKMLERMLPKMVRIDKEMAKDLHWINADPVQIEQVLMNLGVNAADAMPDGGVLTISAANTMLTEAHCATHPEIDPGEYVHLKVSDTGIGMDENTAQRAFEPFFTTKTAGKGTGLGLATAYGIITSMDGHIICESEPGKGTVFNIYFPAMSCQESEDEKRETPASGKYKTGNEAILLVDDEASVREVAQGILERCGYKVFTAASGEEAYDLYCDPGISIDLIMLDLGMPGMGGLKCLKKIIQFDPEAKVLIASGYGQADTIESAMESGAAGFLSKPYPLEKMSKKVRAILDGTGSDTESPPSVCEAVNL